MEGLDGAPPVEKKNEGGDEEIQLEDILGDLGVKTKGGFDPEAEIGMAEEAKKPFSERVREIEKRLNDDSDLLVNRGRKIGVALAGKGLIEESDLEGLFLNDRVVEDILRDQNDQGGDGELEKAGFLTNVRDSLIGLTGKDSIAEPLRDDDLTASEGRRRLKGQEAAVVLEAALYELASSKLDDGDVMKGIGFLRKARPNWISPPERVSRSLSGAADLIDVLDEKHRKVLAEAGRDITWWGIDSSIRTKIEGTSENLGSDLFPMEKLYAKAVEARKEEDRIEKDRLAREVEEKYRKDMETRLDFVLDGAMEIAEKMVEVGGVNRHGQLMQVDFSSLDAGEQVLSGFYKVVKNSDEFLGTNISNRKYGVKGRIDALLKISRSNNVKGKLIDNMSENSYSDYGNRSKREYGEAGEMDEWRKLWEVEFEAEVKGQSLGFIIGFLKKESWEQGDEALMKQALEIFGEGKAFDKLFGEHVDPDSVDSQLLRQWKSFLENLREMKSSGDERKEAEVNGIVTKLGNLPQLARDVDVQVLRQKKEEERERIEEKKGISSGIERWLEKVGEMELMVEDLDSIGSLSEVIDDWRHEDLLSLINVFGADDLGGEISFGVNDEAVRKVNDAIKHYSDNLSKSGGGEASKEIRQGLKQLELKRLFLSEAKDLLGRYDGRDSGDGGDLVVEKRKKGFMQGSENVTAVGSRYFDNISTPGMLLFADLGDQARKEIGRDVGRDLGDLSGFKEQLESLKDVPDGDLSEEYRRAVRESVGEIESFYNEMFEASSPGFRGRLEEKTRDAARELVKTRLREYLEDRQRVALTF
jgi:hypothetical protein